MATEDEELAAALAMSMDEDSGAASGGGGGSTEEAMASALGGACRELELAQPPERRATAIKTLRKLVDNLIAAPENPKFRRLRVSNAKIQAAVLGVGGGEPFLRALGFTESSATDEHAAGAFLEIAEEAARDVQRGLGALALAELRHSAAAGNLLLSHVLASQVRPRQTIALPLDQIGAPRWSNVAPFVRRWLDS
eukprot:SAG11_NODE_3054_length_2725_cov_4.495811_4_plen_195_part_00